MRKVFRAPGLFSTGQEGEGDSVAAERINRRSCERFVIPGATVCYIRDSLFPGRDFGKDFYPLFDISRGGLRFLSHDRITVGSRLLLKITLPEEEPLVMGGTVRWSGLHGGRSYEFEIGVQFAPYGKEGHYNPPSALERITSWEARFGESSGRSSGTQGTSDSRN